MHPSVIQTPPPLKLRPRPLAGPPTPAEDMPPSYPMQPIEMGMDLFDIGGDPEETESGIIRRAPYQYGHWVMQPAYNQALTLMLDTKKGQLWTRAHAKVGAEWQPERVARSLSEIQFPDELRWVQVLRVGNLTPEGISLLRFALVVQDFVHSSWNHNERRNILKDLVPELGVKTLPVDGAVYLIPEFPEKMGEDLWAALHLMNASWKREFYKGITMKHATARYYKQMEDANQQSLCWQDHKFSDPLPNVDDEA